jgi:hypothetical protein
MGLTYCCNAVLQTATTAAMKPFVLTLTSLTVQIATPTNTTIMLSFVSLEYPILSNTTSKKHDTGIMLSLAICTIPTKTHENNNVKYGCIPTKGIQPQITDSGSDATENLAMHFWIMKNL